MAIVSTDIKYRLSGGAANSDPTISYGGAKSSVDASSTIFDNVTSAEALAGDTEYRCIYVHNNHGSLTALSTKVWIQVNTPSSATEVALGLAAAAINATETAVANENTAPGGGVTFATTPVDLATGLTIGDLPPGQHKAIWVRRVVTGGATVASDSFTLRVQCDTLP